MSSRGRKMKMRMSLLVVATLVARLAGSSRVRFDPPSLVLCLCLCPCLCLFWLLNSAFCLHSSALFCLNPRLFSQCGHVGCYGLLPGRPPILSQHLLAYGLKGWNRRWLPGVKEQHVITRS